MTHVCGRVYYDSAVLPLRAVMSWLCCISVFILRKKVAFAAVIQVFVACQRSIPTTMILPKLELDSIETLEELTKQCCVDAASAQASIEEDAIMIKKKIMEDSEEKYVFHCFSYTLFLIARSDFEKKQMDHTSGPFRF